MSNREPKQYWKSLPERDADPAFLQAAQDEFPPLDQGGLNRRDFLLAAGFAFTGTMLTGCQRGPLPRAPVRLALPFLEQPENVIPGRALDYASTCGGCTSGCGLLVKTRDGRPIKLEGNPEQPLSEGGLCAVGQASILGLYDRQTLRHPLQNGRPAGWDKVDSAIRGQLDHMRRECRPVRVLSRTVTSPSLQAMVKRFLANLPDGRHVVYDPLSCSAILDAHERTHGVRVLPHYRFEQASVIVSFDADCLGTWISPVEFTAGYRAGRIPHGAPPRCSYHVQLEARLSLTGSKADRRIRLVPAEVGLAMTHLAQRIAGLAGVPFRADGIEEPPVPSSFLDHLARQLWQARKQALVVCGSQDVTTQVLCNFVNHLLGSYGTTLDVEAPSYQRQGNDRQLQALLAELREEKLGALFVVDCNPVYELPGGEELADLLRRVPLVVTLAERLDETARVSQFVCPPPHFLASWGDAEPVAGLVSVMQPTMRPLGDTRQVLQCFAAWLPTPMPGSALALIRQHWQQHIFPRQKGVSNFQQFWDQSVHDGYVEVEPRREQAKPFAQDAVQPVLRARRPVKDGFALVLYPKVGLLEGRHAYNPWLQELPDPITKATWDNYACLSPAAAGPLGVTDGDVVQLKVQPGGLSLELPVLIQPGQHDQVVAVALGYGSRASERFATVGPQWLQARPTPGPNGLVGSNAAPLLIWEEGTLRYDREAVSLTRTGRKHPLASTQTHHTITVPPRMVPPGQERRPIVQETTLTELSSPSAPPPPHSGRIPLDLWPEDHPAPGSRWGMVIDLQACTGCSACVVACQVENNIPVVGKDEVRRHREMHWLRIDRYYSGDGGDMDVLFQPMLCQHCANAPCEVVCPVLATVHSAEGLNQQVYNRCVGTRYCANNCPYKARRFNWFDYPHNDTLQNLVLNPDVTVRSRGVMEKCSFCVQRIQEAKYEARRLGQPLEDGDIQTACQQSCPAGAIYFGDLNDPESQVSQLLRDPRRYQVLAELNVRPSVSYLKVMRNRPGEGGGGNSRG